MNHERILKGTEKFLGKKGVEGIGFRVSKISTNESFDINLGNFKSDSRFFIASTTKLFTTAIIFQLIDSGKLNLNDKISKFLSEEQLTKLNFYNNADRSNEIEVIDLLMHTSGIPDYFMGKQGSGKSLEDEIVHGNDRSLTLNETLTLAKSLKTTFPPKKRNKALYSDTNYQILGFIAETILGKSYKQIVQENIIESLNMHSTYLYETGIIDEKLLPLRYKDHELHVPQIMSSFKPDGGIVSTLDDMEVFTKAFFSQKLFKFNIEEILSHGTNRIFFPLQYSLGIMKFQLPRIFTLFRKVPALYGHSGLSGAFAYYVPEKDLVMVGTVNQIANPSISYNLMMRIVMGV